MNLLPRGGHVALVVHPSQYLRRRQEFEVRLTSPGFTASLDHRFDMRYWEQNEVCRRTKFFALRPQGGVDLPEWQKTLNARNPYRTVRKPPHPTPTPQCKKITASATPTYYQMPYRGSYHSVLEPVLSYRHPAAVYPRACNYVRDARTKVTPTGP